MSWKASGLRYWRLLSATSDARMPMVLLTAAGSLVGPPSTALPLATFVMAASTGPLVLLGTPCHWAAGRPMVAPIMFCVPELALRCRRKVASVHGETPDSLP